MESVVAEPTFTPEPTPISTRLVSHNYIVVTDCHYGNDQIWFKNQSGVPESEYGYFVMINGAIQRIGVEILPAEHSGFVFFGEKISSGDIAFMIKDGSTINEIKCRE